MGWRKRSWPGTPPGQQRDCEIKGSGLLPLSTSSFVACICSAAGTVRLLFPMRDIIGDDLGRAHRSLVEMQKVGDFPLYPFTLAVQEIA